MDKSKKEDINNKMNIITNKKIYNTISIKEENGDQIDINKPVKKTNLEHKNKLIGKICICLTVLLSLALIVFGVISIYTVHSYFDLQSRMVIEEEYETEEANLHTGDGVAILGDENKVDNNVE